MHTEQRHLTSSSANLSLEAALLPSHSTSFNLFPSLTYAHQLSTTNLPAKLPTFAYPSTNTFPSLSTTLSTSQPNFSPQSTTPRAQPIYPPQANSELLSFPTSNSPKTFFDYRVMHETPNQRKILTKEGVKVLAASRNEKFQDSNFAVMLFKHTTTADERETLMTSLILENVREYYKMVFLTNCWKAGLSAIRTSLRGIKRSKKKNPTK